MNSLRHLKGFLRNCAIVLLLLLAGFLFAGVTPRLIEQNSAVASTVLALLWTVYGFGLFALVSILASKK